MKIKSIKLEYEKPDKKSSDTIVIIDNVPKSILNEISRRYNREIQEEGVCKFIEMMFGDIRLKFRLQK